MLLLENNIGKVNFAPCGTFKGGGICGGVTDREAGCAAGGWESNEGSGRVK